MKRIAKWVVILWSIFCLIGVIYGMAKVGERMGDLTTAPEQTGATLGMGCGMGVWVIFWIVVAGPAMFIYLISGKKEQKKPDPQIIERESHLCTECGKYFEGNPSYCPNCGKPTNLRA